MSSRQRNRIASKKIEATADKSEDDDDLVELQSRSQAKRFNILDENEVDDSEDDDGIVEHNNNKEDKKNLVIQTPSIAENSLNKDEITTPDCEPVCVKHKSNEKIKCLGGIEEFNFSHQSASVSETQSVEYLFSVPSSGIDVDVVLRKRFGATAVISHELEENNRRKGIRNHNRPKVGLRRFMFGVPKEGWPRPPSYLGGGIGMSQISSKSKDLIEPENPLLWFQFIWSEEYSKLNQNYLEIQSSGDVNRLVIFLSQNPNHVEGLLQLAVVFSRTGQMDRATDLVRRSIYVLECAFMEAFKPHVGNCRLDPSQLENSTLFIALWRHMQMTCMLGCPSVAANIACILYSLNPSHDSMSVLLSLDHLLIRSELFDRLFQLFDSNFTIGNNIATESPKDGLKDVPSSSEEDLTVHKDGLSDSRAVVTIQDMPGWRFSVALAARLKYCATSASSNSSTGRKLGGIGENQGIGGGSGVSVPNRNADAELREALLCWPFFLRPLVELSSRDVAASAGWDKTLHHRFFQSVLSRLSESSQYAIFTHLAIIYASRNDSIWKRGDAMLWLQTVAAKVTVEVDQMSPKQYSQLLESLFERLSRLSTCPCLLRYLHTQVEDFGEEYPRLPPEANPLDARLMDPRLLAAGGHQLAARMNLDRLFGGHELIPEDLIQDLLAGNVEDDVFVAQLRRRLRIPEEQALFILANIRRQHPNILLFQNQLAVQYLDLNMPLLQLFWQSLLPWNEVDPRVINRRL